MESGVVMAATGEITFSITRRSQILTLFSIDMLVLQRDSQMIEYPSGNLHSTLSFSSPSISLKSQNRTHAKKTQPL